MGTPYGSNGPLWSRPGQDGCLLELVIAPLVQLDMSIVGIGQEASNGHVRVRHSAPIIALVT